MRSSSYNRSSASSTCPVRSPRAPTRSVICPSRDSSTGSSARAVAAAGSTSQHTADSTASRPVSGPVDRPGNQALPGAALRVRGSRGDITFARLCVLFRPRDPAFCRSASAVRMKGRGKGASPRVWGEAEAAARRQMGRTWRVPGPGAGGRRCRAGEARHPRGARSPEVACDWPSAVGRRAVFRRGRGDRGLPHRPGRRPGPPRGQLRDLLRGRRQPGPHPTAAERPRRARPAGPLHRLQPQLRQGGRHAHAASACRGARPW